MDITNWQTWWHTVQWSWTPKMTPCFFLSCLRLSPPMFILVHLVPDSLLQSLVFPSIFMSGISWKYCLCMIKLPHINRTWISCIIILHHDSLHRAVKFKIYLPTPKIYLPTPKIYLPPTVERLSRLTLHIPLESGINIERSNPNTKMTTLYPLQYIWLSDSGTDILK